LTSEELLNISVVPVAKQNIIGKVSHNGMLVSFDLCTIGAEIILSSNPSESKSRITRIPPIIALR